MIAVSAHTGRDTCVVSPVRVHISYIPGIGHHLRKEYNEQTTRRTRRPVVATPTRGGPWTPPSGTHSAPECHSPGRSRPAHAVAPGCPPRPALGHSAVHSHTAQSGQAHREGVRSGFGLGRPNPCVSSTYRDRARYRGSVAESRSMARPENPSGFFKLLIQ